MFLVAMKLDLRSKGFKPRKWCNLGSTSLKKLIIMLEKTKIEKYLGTKVGISTSSGKYLFGTLIEVSEGSCQIQFLNRARVLVIPFQSIISIKSLSENVGRS